MTEGLRKKHFAIDELENWLWNSSKNSQQKLSMCTFEGWALKIGIKRNSDYIEK